MGSTDPEISASPPVEQVFRRMRIAPAYKAVSAEIERIILSGALEPGAPLPTEQELAQQFGVNRSTVREAIRQVEQEGLVEFHLLLRGEPVRVGAGAPEKRLQLCIGPRRHVLAGGRYALGRGGQCAHAVQAAAAAMTINSTRRRGSARATLAQARVGLSPCTIQLSHTSLKPS